MCWQLILIYNTSPFKNHYTLMFYLKVKKNLSKECNCLCDEPGSNLPSNTSWWPHSWQWLITILYLLQTLSIRWLLHHLFWLKNHITQPQEVYIPHYYLCLHSDTERFKFLGAWKLITSCRQQNWIRSAKEQRKSPLLRYVSNQISISMSPQYFH